MKKQIFKTSIIIDAPKETIWKVLFNDDTYRQWTSVFHPGSYAETDWKEGSKAFFKTPEGSGMASIIKRHQPCELLVIEHQGVIKDHKEYYDLPEAKTWQGLETYRLHPFGDQMQLAIEQDIAEEYLPWFTETWEKALQKVKELSENKL
jgi:uncharacterized protein YndB with AHSA1/START domain